MQENPAYNLDAFAARAPKERLRVAPVQKKKRGLSRYNKQAIKIVAVTTLFLALVCSVLYSQTMLTELGAQMVAQEKEMVQLQSEYTYLSTEMEMKTSLKNVEQYASAQLGLVKLDKSQIVYVNRERSSDIVCAQSWLSKLTGSAALGSMNFLMEYQLSYGHNYG